MKQKPEDNGLLETEGKRVGERPARTHKRTDNQKTERHRTRL